MQGSQGGSNKSYADQWTNEFKEYCRGCLVTAPNDFLAHERSKVLESTSDAAIWTIIPIYKIVR